MSAKITFFRRGIVSILFLPLAIIILLAICAYTNVFSEEVAVVVEENVSGSLRLVDDSEHFPSYWRADSSCNESCMLLEYETYYVDEYDYETFICNCFTDMDNYLSYKISVD